MIEIENLKPGDYVIAEFGVMSPTGQTFTIEGFVQSVETVDHVLALRNGKSIRLDANLPVTITKVENIVDFESFGRAKSMRKHPSNFRR